MSPNKKAGGRNRIPIEFLDTGQDSEENNDSPNQPGRDNGSVEDLPEQFANPEGASEEEDASDDSIDASSELDDGDLDDDLEDEELPHQASQRTTGELGGPVLAELVATRAELKRVEGEIADLKDRLARRQADFENYRKRVERERADTYERAVAEIAAKLLPVLDNLKRALDVEANVEPTESDEFRHFLSGVDLIYKQLTGVLEALGVKPITAVGAPFDPHIHEAVVSESTDEYEPDTVMQEIIRGYRLGEKLIRPALVKVAVKK